MASSARIDELRKKFEENPRRYFAPLANEYRKAGEIEQAIAICREYLPQQPGHMSGHIVYGQALYEARQFDEAKTVFETALALDPENLIALRHLGDIALIIGDGEAARGWYRRVLEADPRNEEIQAQLASLDKAAAGAGAGDAASAPTPPAGTTAAATTPASAPTVVTSAVKPPPPTPVTATSPTAEVRLDAVPPPQPLATPVAVAPPLLDVALDIPAAPAAAAAPPPADFAVEHTSMATGEPAPTQRLELDSPVAGATAGGAGAPPMAGFSLEGLETTSLAGEPPSRTPSTPGAAPLDIEMSTSVSFTPPPAPAAEPGLLDLDLGAPAGPTASATTAEPTPPAQPASAPAPRLSTAIGELLDLSAVPEEPATAPATPAPVSPSLDDIRLDVPPAREPEAAPAPPESGPFVTETMAELYLKQGHRDEALRVYRALLEQKPGDATLRARIASLESPAREPAKPVVPIRPPQLPPRPAPPAPRAGPTIREVLFLVASRRPGHRASVAPAANGGAAAPGPAMPAPATQAVVADALSAIFGRPAIAPADEAAAIALAQAFGAGNGSPATAPASAPDIVGEPARRANNELSLDSVFGGAGTPAAPSSFSFDQFFSQRASTEQGAAEAAEGGAQSQEDVAQFTQWLEGLKQR